MPEHSPEPWRAAKVFGDGTLEDLERIVACVKFCKGVIFKNPTVTLDDLLAGIIGGVTFTRVNPIMVRREGSGWSIDLVPKADSTSATPRSTPADSPAA